MYEKYYTQRLHEVHNGEVVNDVYVEEFETPDKHIVKGTKNNNPFLFVLRNSPAPITTEAVQNLLAQENKQNKTNTQKQTKSNRKTVKKRKYKNTTKRSKQSSKASKTNKKK